MEDTGNREKHTVSFDPVTDLNLNSWLHCEISIPLLIFEETEPANRINLGITAC